jgi:hypothetical protein
MEGADQSSRQWSVTQKDFIHRSAKLSSNTEPIHNGFFPVQATQMVAVTTKKTGGETESHTKSLDQNGSFFVHQKVETGDRNGFFFQCRQPKW